MNRRIDCSQVMRSESVVVSGGEREAGTIYISPQITAENKGNNRADGHSITSQTLCDGCK